MFYKLYYRGKMLREDGLVEASSRERAVEVGQKFCAAKGFKYIGVEDPVVAREEEYFPKAEVAKKAS